MKAAVYSTKNFEVPFLKKFNDSKHELEFVYEPLSENNIGRVSGKDAIISFPNDNMSASILDKLHEEGIQHIATRSAGTDHIDLEHAQSLGFKVASVPAYSPHSIAEHTIGMILALNRHLRSAEKKVKDHDFRLDGLIGIDIHEATVGVVGAGKIGATLVKILDGFGTNILIYDPVKNESLEKDYKAKYVPLDELISQSDIISIHVPLNEETHHLIDATKISKMKKGVMLLNAGRGAVLKTTDVIEGLKEGKIGSLGIDVYEHEKGIFFYDHSGEVLKDDQLSRLIEMKNVMITGHQAFLTHNALNNIAKTTFETLDAWQKDQASPYQL